MELKFTIIAGHAGAPEQATSHVFGQTGGVIGRNADCNWVLHCRNKTVSRYHMRVTYDNGRYFIRDISANGIYINGADEVAMGGVLIPVQAGDTYQLGEFVLRAELLGAEQTSSAQMSNTQLSEMGAEMGAADAITGQRWGQAANGAQTGWGQTANAAHALPDNWSASEFEDDGDTLYGLAATNQLSPDDQFDVPEAIIPEDWELGLDITPKQEPSPVVEVVQRLGSAGDAGRDALMNAFAKGLGVQGAVSPEQLTPELMQHIGEALSTAVVKLHALSRAQDDIISKLSLDSAQINHPAIVELNRLAEPEQLLEALQAGEKNSVAGLIDTVCNLFQRQRSLAITSFGKAVVVILDHFEPRAIEERYRQARAEKRLVSGFWKRLRAGFTGRVAYWLFYWDEYRELRKASNKALRSQFEKAFANALVERLNQENVPPQTTENKD